MRRLLFLFVCLVSLSSCRSVQDVAEPRIVPNISENKLFKNIAEQSFDYQTVFIKKVDISLKTGKKKDNLSGSIKIDKDKFIWLSMSGPLGIELGRALLTPDSVKLIDSYNKEYLFTDYSFFNEKLDLDLNFYCIQYILTNTFFNLGDCINSEAKDSKFKFENTKNDYLLSNVHKRSENRRIKKFQRKKQRNKDYTLLLQKVHIDPFYFRPSRISLEDLDDDFIVSVDYKDFKDIERRKFPTKMLFDFLNNEHSVQLELKFSKFEFDQVLVPNFRLTSKHKPVMNPNN